MAKGPQIISFTGGEVDEYIDVRVTDAGAETRAKRLENIFLQSAGAQELAPGWLHIGSTPSNSLAKLRPWMRSETLAYALELSAGLVRFIYGSGYQTLAGAAATPGTFADGSGAPSTGGGTAPPSGALTVSAAPDLVDDGYDNPVTCTVTGGSGSYIYAIENLSGGLVYPDDSTAATARFYSEESGRLITNFRWVVTDAVSGVIGYSNNVDVVSDGPSYPP